MPRKKKGGRSKKRENKQEAMFKEEEIGEDTIAVQLSSMLIDHAQSADKTMKVETRQQLKDLLSEDTVDEMSDAYQEIME